MRVGTYLTINIFSLHFSFKTNSLISIIVLFIKPNQISAAQWSICTKKVIKSQIVKTVKFRKQCLYLHSLMASHNIIIFKKNRTVTQQCRIDEN